MINPLNGPRIRFAIGGSVAATALMVAAITTSSAADPAPAPQGIDTSGAAAWAEANGLSGLSPTSATERSATTNDLTELRVWAEANGLTGLSPASLRLVESG